MAKLQVIGYVGEDVLQGIDVDPRLKTQIMKALRDGIEDTLENQFDVFAQLGISREDALQLRVKGEIADDLLSSITSAAEAYIADFKATKLSDFLSGDMKS